MPSHYLGKYQACGRGKVPKVCSLETRTARAAEIFTATGQRTIDLALSSHVIPATCIHCLRITRFLGVVQKLRGSRRNAAWAADGSSTQLCSPRRAGAAVSLAVVLQPPVFDLSEKHWYWRLPTTANFRWIDKGGRVIGNRIYVRHGRHAWALALLLAAGVGKCRFSGFEAPVVVLTACPGHMISRLPSRMRRRPRTFGLIAFSSRTAFASRGRHGQVIKFRSRTKFFSVVRRRAATRS